ncbi:MAG: FkbM family methyltransferase [Ectothiorhodospiraceae bacterium]|nr:FkbM family methyltransferase [Ectothiorhodospiraceae bacterium]MCH8503376.1 FkbM family methyltransferase [Ectothiorhodospiraceae bacterium]
MKPFASWLFGGVEKRAAKRARLSTREGLFQSMLEQFCEQHEAGGGARFLQIGANDGRTNDPLFPVIQRFNLVGICVEPLPEAFELLQETYRGNANVTLVQRAVGPSEGQMDLYMAGLPEAATDEDRKDAYRKATLSRESAIAKTRKACKLSSDAEAEGRLECRQVQASTLVGLVEEFGNPRVDILQIDAEGEDWNILRQAEALPSLPAFVNLEHKGLDREQRAEMHAWFSREGYLWFEHGRDTCGLLIQREA